MTQHKHQKGIALLLTIVLSGLVLLTAAAFTKEMLDEVKNSTRIDHSMVAYYAAEAGLEKALLEWRTGGYRAEMSDQELDDQAKHVVVSNDPAKNKNSDPACFDLKSDARVNKAACMTGAGRDFRTPYVGIKMWYKTDQVTNQRVNKDEIYEFEIPEMLGNVNLSWDQGTQNLPSNTGFRVEISGYRADGTIISAAEGGKFFTCTYTDRQRLEPGPLGTMTRVFRLKPWYTNDVNDCRNQPTTGAPVTTPETPYINLSIDPDDGTLIGLPVTQIESTGYYGGVARRITAQLDRTNGNIIGVFDYVIYSESELVK